MKHYHQNKRQSTTRLIGHFTFLLMKPKGVTTQMKALDKYIPMVLFVLLN